jgi:dinuclear metal center YbgI/SA1388 family protein
MTIGDLLAQLGRTAPWAKAADWDPVGLQLGDPHLEVTSVAVIHEITEEVTERLLGSAPHLAITYHPLLFQPVHRMVAGRSPAGRALRLVRAGVAVAVIHTNFDVASGGAADALAETVGLLEVEVFGPVAGPETVKVVTFVPSGRVDDVTAAMSEAGAGVIGNYTHCSYRSEGSGSFYAGEGTSPAVGIAGGINEEAEERVEMVAPRTRETAVVAALVNAHPYEEPAFDVYEVRSNEGFIGRVGALAEPVALAELAGRVGATLDEEAIRFAGDPSRRVARVAVVPGSGSEFIEAAAQAGADVLVSGDVSHHQAVVATDRGLAIIDPGHTAGERPGVRRLYAAVADIVPEALDWTGVDTTPWKWKI